MSSSLTKQGDIAMNCISTDLLIYLYFQLFDILEKDGAVDQATDD